jgi:hypothetical protein
MLRVFVLTCIGITCLGVPGCKKGDVKDFIPPDAAARKALTTVLDTWKSGQSFGPVADGPSKIEVGEFNWQAGKKLTGYEIVGPTTGEDQNQRYSVKITLEGAAAPEETVYVVFGKPTALEVYNQADYQKFTGMSQ